jgi:GH18 family chitinase
VTPFKDFHLNLFRDALRIGTKMVLSLGSYGEETMSAKGFMIALANDKSRAEFLDQIISVVVKFNFAGVAFHWIYPGCPQVF